MHRSQLRAAIEALHADVDALKGERVLWNEQLRFDEASKRVIALDPAEVEEVERLFPRSRRAATAFQEYAEGLKAKKGTVKILQGEATIT